MSLLDRLKHEEEPGIPGHMFYGALIGLSLGELTRSQIESFWNIGTTGADKVEMDFLINTYQSAVDKQKYINAVHAVFMLLEGSHDTGFDLNKTQIQAWLTSAAS